MQDAVAALFLFGSRARDKDEWTAAKAKLELSRLLHDKQQAPRVA